MQFAIDENIPRGLYSWLEEKGHDIFLIPKGTPDEEVAKITKKKKSLLLTLNRHFANTLRFPPKDFPGIIRVKIHPSYLEDIIFSLEKLFHSFTRQEDFRGKLIILNKYGFFKSKE